MNKYIIHCITAWCGVYEDYAALAKCESDLDDIAQNLAYNLFLEADGWETVAEEHDYDPESMTEEDWYKLYEIIDEAMYYRYETELVDEDDKEALKFWEECDLVYDGSKE